MTTVGGQVTWELLQNAVEKSATSSPVAPSNPHIGKEIASQEIGRGVLGSHNPRKRGGLRA
jgi:hypothetical protein